MNHKKSAKQRMSEIKNSLRSSRYHFTKKHPNQLDARFRVPLKLGQVDELITIIDEQEYMIRTLQSLGNQLEQIYPELDTLTRLGKSVYKTSDRFGAAADGKAILDAVFRIEEIIGKREDIEIESDTDEGATL